MEKEPSFAWIDGRVVPYAEARVPIDDRGLVFGESLYEVLPITAGLPRLLPEHVARLRMAAPELGLEAGVPELAAWQHIVAALLSRERVEEGLLYAQVTGGSAPREHVPKVAPRPTFFAHITPFRFPRDEQVMKGIRAISLPDIRWARCDLKTTMLLPSVLAKREATRRGASEALLVGASGSVHEGASSNVFCVEGAALLTPAQSSSLLPGTMRPLVCQVALEAGLEVRCEERTLAQLRRADELFITSSSQLVMPVLELDGAQIGSGAAGPIARDLARRLRERLELGA